MECKALSTPNTDWSFCPNIGASIFFAVLFAMTTFAHLFQAIYYRKSYCWVIIMSSLWQLLTYIFRTISIETPANTGYYAAWFVLMLIAPLWTNAFVYMMFGRLVWNYGPDRKVWGIPARRFGLVFVCLDIVAFLVQVYGASAASNEDATNSQILQALYIYMGGVGLQLVFILIFSGFGFRLLQAMRTDGEKYPNTRTARHLLYTLFAVLFFIIVRIIFRIVEYSSGLTSSIPNHEAFQYCLDSLPMFLALALFNVVHPGRILRGKETEMPPGRGWCCCCSRRR